MLPVLALLIAGQAAPAACPAIVPPPRGLEAWAVPGNRPGVGMRFDLAGSRSAAGLTAEERARGGTATIIWIDVPRAGNYGIALSDAAWIDVMRDGKALPSVGHDHGPACTGIRKIVRFALLPGRHQLRLTGIKASSIGVLIAPQ